MLEIAPKIFKELRFEQMIELTPEYNIKANLIQNFKIKACLYFKMILKLFSA